MSFWSALWTFDGKDVGTIDATRAVLAKSEVPTLASISADSSTPGTGVRFRERYQDLSEKWLGVACAKVRDIKSFAVWVWFCNSTIA